jgi:hypothetical protein
MVDLDRASIISPPFLNPDIISEGVLAMDHNNESYF